MITLEEIVSRLGDRESKVQKRSSTAKNDWRPVVASSYTVPLCPVDKWQGRKKTNILRKVLAFIDRIEHLRASTGCTIMPISTRSAANMNIWGSAKNVSNGIDYMKELGLISDEDPSFHHGKSKTYRYYKENEDRIKDYCHKQGIIPAQVTNYNNFTKGVKEIDLDARNVVFSCRLHLKKPVDCSMSEFEDYLLMCLYNNYPEFPLHQKIADDINKMYYKGKSEFKIRFIPRFTWSADNTYVKGIGIRATNSLCSVKRENRGELKKKYGFVLEKDVKSSVPRITWSLNHGTWLDEDIDLYEMIYKEMGGGEAFTNEIREAIKTLHMSAYFDSTDKKMAYHIWRRMDKNGLNNSDVYDRLIELRQAMVKAEGGRLYNNEIFLAESCIYLDTLYDLLSAGYKVWELYDCFYAADIGTDIDFERLVRSGIEKNFRYYYKDFIEKKKDREIDR